MGMNLADVGKVLAKASAFDGRKMSEVQAMAWLEVLAPYDLADCLEAVTEHFATSDVYLMPIHIKRIVDANTRRRREIERHNAAVAAIDTLEHSAIKGPVRSVDVAALVARLRESLPDTSAEDVFRRAEWVEADRERARVARESEGANPAYTGPPEPLPERPCLDTKDGTVHGDHVYMPSGLQRELGNGPGPWWCPGLTEAQRDAL